MNYAINTVECFAIIMLCLLIIILIIIILMVIMSELYFKKII